MIEFSIIIPVYNAEKTLHRCLESVCNQTLCNYEVILIDDGSSDRSLEICEEYAKNDRKYHVIHQENSGPSAARNKGLSVARGEWICFVDSDDTIEKNYLQLIRSKINEEKADVIFLSYCSVDENGEKDKHIANVTETDKWEKIIELSEQDMFGYTWIKCFRKRIIESIKFNQKLNLFEDEVFTCEALKKDVKVSVLKEPVYDYYIGDGTNLISKTHEDYCLKCEEVYQAWKRMLDKDVKAHDFLERKADVFVSRCYYYAFERDVSLRNYFQQLKGTNFFMEHKEYYSYDKAVKNNNYLKLEIEKMKYRIKVRISSVLKGKKGK